MSDDRKELDEVEITAEMLRAGADAFYDWQGLEYGNASAAAEVIFRAMASLAPKPRTRSRKGKR